MRTRFMWRVNGERSEEKRACLPPIGVTDCWAVRGIKRWRVNREEFSVYCDTITVCARARGGFYFGAPPRTTSRSYCFSPRTALSSDKTRQVTNGHFFGRTYVRKPQALIAFIIEKSAEMRKRNDFTSERL